MNAFNCHSCENNLFNTPERLVLEGYRHWVAGMAIAQRPDLARIESLYSEYLPFKQVQPALSALMGFINALGICSTCPLKTFQVGSGHLCKDEAMVLALIAALQYGDAEAAELSLTSLSCKNRCAEVAVAAGELALILKSANHVLMPISISVMENILAFSRATRHAGDAESHPAPLTLH
ncbi:hypothetical protein [Pararhizobium sp. IMCC21322]|uniref:hypothetical protein n=1 Tax=Pararhizobium sp. IMCC21322 TaxID=3067903 RepID=UPI00274256A6|nr:hypothetical protein [Pararhizobium sp. IMCC21322]